MNISVHVIDSAFGIPAADVYVRFQRLSETAVEDVTDGRTGTDGFLTIYRKAPVRPGSIYRLVFDLDQYYSTMGSIPLYPRAIVDFRVQDHSADFHLPLLISPNSFLTYRANLAGM